MTWHSPEPSWSARPTSPRSSRGGVARLTTLYSNPDNDQATVTLDSDPSGAGVLIVLLGMPHIAGNVNATVSLIPGVADESMAYTFSNQFSVTLYGSTITTYAPTGSPGVVRHVLAIR